MNGLIHSYAVSVELEPHAGAWLDDVRAEAQRLADRLGYDVVFTFNRCVHAVRPRGPADESALKLSIHAPDDEQRAGR